MFTDTREFPIPAGQVNLVSPERLKAILARIAVLAAIASGMWLAVSASSRPADTIDAPPGSFLSLDERPSHNRRYRAEVVAAPAIAVGVPQTWTIHIDRRSGQRVANARVAIRTWMPDEDSISLSNAGITYVGGGRYRIDHLRFPKAGWWNLALVIDGVDGVDSLAFNLILPDTARAPHSVP